MLCCTNTKILKDGDAMTFKQWILQFANENSPRGDLAEDIRLDAGFPDSSSYNEIYDYLFYKNASVPCLESFDEAWQLYNRI